MPFVGCNLPLTSTVHGVQEQTGLPCVCALELDPVAAAMGGSGPLVHALSALLVAELEPPVELVGRASFLSHTWYLCLTADNRWVQACMLCFVPLAGHAGAWKVGRGRFLGAVPVCLALGFCRMRCKEGLRAPYVQHVCAAASQAHLWQEYSLTTEGWECSGVLCLQ